MSIAWKRAAKLCGADTKEVKGWPERLSFEQAAILAAGNCAADYMAALEAMREAVEQGDLPAEDAERPREVRMLLREPDRFEVLHAGPCKMVSASDVLAWLDEQGQDPGEHVRAWDDCIQDRRGRELARAAAGQIGLFQPVETPPAVAMAEAARMGLAGLLASKAIQSPPEFLTGREVPEPLTEEGQRKRRAELAEEDERIRLRVREQWEMEQREAVGEADQESRPELTPLKRAAIIKRLGRKYQGLESALNRGEEWAKACRVPGRNGWYYLERIEAECRARYGGAAPAPAADLSPAGQLLRFVR